MVGKETTGLTFSHGYYLHRFISYRFIAPISYHLIHKVVIMPREATITPEQIFAVADALQAEGKRPTLLAVLDRLGRGSMSAINGHMQRWREAQGRPHSVQPILPPALQRSIMDFIAAEVAAAQTPLEADLAEQKQVVADLAIECEHQTTALEERAEQIAKLEAQRASAEGRAVQLDLELVAAKADATRERQAAEAALTELARVAVHLESLGGVQHQLSAVQEALEDERLGRIEAEQQVAALSARQKDLEGRLVELRQELERHARAQGEGAQARIDQLLERLPAANDGSRAAKPRLSLPPRIGNRAALEARPPQR